MPNPSILNENLKAVRMIAGLNQSEAALLVNVDRATFNRWETGKRDIPEVKFAKLLRAAGVAYKDIDEYFARQPRKLAYDADGYPAPYSKARHLDDIEGVTAALETLEGVEYPMRARERERIRVLPVYGDNIDGLNRYMARYDAEQH
jgi:transcriptional regulator with XRE-family HTH domain